MEGRDDVDGSLANIEKALQVLTEQLPGKVRGSAGRVGWMCLNVLHCMKEEVLAEVARV